MVSVLTSSAVDSVTCLILHTIKEPWKCVGLYRMSKYLGLTFEFTKICSASISLPVFSYPVNFHFSLKCLLSVLLLDELTSVTTKEKVHNEQTLDLQYIRLFSLV
jgi:hypothetical protein